MSARNDAKFARPASSGYIADDMQPLESGLRVLAYHRLGRRDQTQFDPWVITADQEQLEKQLRFLQRHYRLVTLEEAMAIASGRRICRGRAVLITFDDGYLDNYQQALPVLRSLAIQATFFLVADFVTEGRLAWWDRMAWQIRSIPDARVCLPVGSEMRPIALRGKSAADAIGEILALYKACPREAQQRFQERLQAAVPATAKPPTDRLFMTAGQARQLLDDGMAIGAHTRTHPILARLSPAEQFDEMHRARVVLEQVIGATIDVMAYPVGGPTDFDATTRSLAAACGYRAAFSCHGGVNVPGRIDLFDIKRTAVYWNAQAEQLMAG